ncbi:MAG: FecR family protein, partial [Dysgonamonadaceae bacterium]|nr:FecR family protein [Dysgonamonadaceae bacterium]
MDEKHNEINELIISCLEQKADKETYDRVEQWARQSPQNERYYREMQEVFMASHLLDSIDNIQQERVWKQLLEKIKIRRKITSRLRRITRWAAAAAFVVLAYFTGSLLSDYMGSSGQHTTASTFDKQLFVVLNDGSKIWLNKDTRLTYPKDYGKKQREVYLTGEA